MTWYTLIRCGGLVLLGVVLASPTAAAGGAPPADREIGFAAGLVENRLARSPDGKWTVRRDGTHVARLVDARASKATGPTLRHTEEFQVLTWAFSPDGKLVATGAGRRHESRAL